MRHRWRVPAIFFTASFEDFLNCSINLYKATTARADFKMPTYKAISKIVAILKCNIGNKRLSPQGCRKGFQNWCYDKGETSNQAVSSWMGHLDVAMSFKVYRNRDGVLVGQAPIEKVL